LFIALLQQKLHIVEYWSLASGNSPEKSQKQASLALIKLAWHTIFQASGDRLRLLLVVAPHLKHGMTSNVLLG
jgi:hypothetical protein